MTTVIHPPPLDPDFSLTASPCRYSLWSSVSFFPSLKLPCRVPATETDLAGRNKLGGLGEREHLLVTLALGTVPGYPTLITRARCVTHAA